MENPQANSVLEGIIQGIANLVHISDKNNYLDEDDPLSCILVDTVFVV